MARWLNSSRANEEEFSQQTVCSSEVYLIGVLEGKLIRWTLANDYILVAPKQINITSFEVPSDGGCIYMHFKEMILNGRKVIVLKFSNFVKLTNLIRQ